MAEGYPFGERFQKRLLAYFIKDPEKMYDLVEPQFFTSPMLVEIARVLRETYTSHGRQLKVSRTTLVELVKITMGEHDSWPLYKEAAKDLFDVKIEDRPVLYAQAAAFAKETKYRETLIAMEKDITSRNYARSHARYDDLKGFGKDHDLGLDYWGDLSTKGIETRWSEDRFGIIGSRCLPGLDKRMGGGIAGGELGIILAGGKVGKTTVLANFAAGAIWQRKKVAIVSGELSSRKYRRRIDSLISGVSSRKIYKYKKKVQEKLQYVKAVSKGNCRIKQFPTGGATTGDIESWLNDLEDDDFTADLLIVDYMALFRPVQRSTEHRLSIGQTAVELRGIAVERGLPVWTASQGNRASLEKRVLTPSDFAEDISQFWTLDFMLALCQDKHEAKHNRCRVLLAAARDFSAGAIVPCTIQRDTYRLIEEKKSLESSSSSESKSDDPKKDVKKELPSDSDHHKTPKVSDDH